MIERDQKMTKKVRLKADIHYGSRAYINTPSDPKKEANNISVLAYFGILALMIAGGTAGTILGTILLGKFL